MPPLQVVEFTISDEAPVNGYTISELELPADATVLAFGKRGQPLKIPDVDLSLETGDRLVVLTDYTVLGDVSQLLISNLSSPMAVFSYPVLWPLTGTYPPSAGLY